MGKCSKCGKEIDDNAKFCTNCGNSVQQEPTNKVAPCGVVGFILSIILAVICPSGVLPSYGMIFLLAIPAVVFCMIGVFDTKHTKHGLAIAGLVITTLAIFVGGIFKISIK